MDKISILGIELWSRVGCTPEERAYPQRLLVDVFLELPLSSAGKSDDIRYTVDYADVVKKIKGALEGKTCNLIETMAEDAARLALADKRVKAVSVKILKRALSGIDSASVEIRRARE